MSSPTAPIHPVADTEDLLAALADARDRTRLLVSGVCEEALEKVHSPLMSPLVWDLGHIAAFEDLWLVHRHGGEPMLHPELVDVYDAFETPRADRGDLPFLRTAEAHAYLDVVRERVLDIAEQRGTGDGVLHELVVRHEQQHNETMLQTLNLARLEGCEPAGRVDAPAGRAGAHTGLELVDVAAGEFELGAPAAGFAYDNERPRHRAELPAYAIGRTPITNATFLSFVEGGGYERRELWSEEAWRWKQQYDITHPMNWTDDGREWRLGRREALHPDKPVVHVSWFEADAFARAHDARLPTEAEWEKAATWDQETATARRCPWGDAPAYPQVHANVDQLAFGTAPVGAFPAGISPCGCLATVGDVWEWTASEFDAYPGFSVFPYREYSEVFFGQGYRVLRGGSWATRARVATPTFRNWDLPQRRQIFSGLRIARDA